MALEDRFDQVRRYVRQPIGGERWGFAQLPLFSGMSRDIQLLLVPEPSMVAVGMRLFGAVFYIDLLNTGELPAWIERERTGFPDLRYWDPEERIPTSVLWNRKREYEILIDIEPS
ncbi:MAG: hypothetical protein ABIR59_08585 [Gemmatimonadales bacterium]